MARRRKGIVGIEAAIVMIAFVIVAAALAFVALNMGMSATQKTKEAIGASMGEAGSSLMVDGDVVAWYDGTNITNVVVPIRISSGKYPVDLSPNKTTVSLQVGGTFYANIYSTIDPTPKAPPVDIGNLLSTVFNGTTDASAVIVFLDGDGDNVLEFSEKALVLVQLNPAANSYDTVKIEIKPPEGSPLVVERVIPPSLPETAGPVTLG
ncbi:MAG: flagellin [Desulfurococcales archaeon]|nr:flagellin [Desulfurococcales archaeon]